MLSVSENAVYTNFQEEAANLVESQAGLINYNLLGRGNSVRHINFQNGLSFVDLDIKLNYLEIK